MIVKVKDLSFGFPHRDLIFNKLSFSIADNQRLGIIGPNGSGKTSLFLLLCGVLEALSGEVFIDGEKLTAGNINDKLNYLFQSPDDQLFSASIFDDVAFGPLNRGLSKNKVLKLVKQSLEKVNLQNFAEKSPQQLSGGEKRLAAMATLLAMDPSIYLLDEPTSNLDALNRRKIIELINSMEKTLLISSHDLEFLLETCDSCMLLDKGKIIALGPIKDILSDQELLTSHHLEMPHSLTPHSHKFNKSRFYRNH